VSAKYDSGYQIRKYVRSQTNRGVPAPVSGEHYSSLSFLGLFFLLFNSLENNYGPYSK
jgi:hypothetical protein